MTKQTINVGTTANDKQGDSLRAAFQKVNANFTELYTALGLDDASLNLGAFEFTGSTMSTTDSTAITIDQATTVTSDLTVGGDIVPSIANGGNLGSLAKPFRSLYVSNNTVYIGGVPIGINGSGQLTVNGSTVSGGGSTAWADITGKPTIPTLTSQLTNDSGFLTSVGTISYNDLSNKPTIPSLGNFAFSGSTAYSPTGTNLWIDPENLRNTMLQIPGPGNETAFPLTLKSIGNVIINSNNNPFTFNTTGGLTFPDATVQTTAYTGPQTSLDGDVTGSVFADDSTLLVDGVSGIVPNSELAKSITQVIDSNATVNTSATITTNNSYTNTVDFSTDVDPGVGYTLDGWYQRNSEQIEFALFGPAAFQTYLIGLALGRTVIVTYSTGSGNQTLTRTLTQAFAATGQSDPANPTWGRVSGRIDATLPADQTGIVSINFPVYSTSNNTWTFGANGDLTLPRGYFKNNTTDGFLTIEGPLFADMVAAGGGGYNTISNGVEIVTHGVGTDTERKFRFSWDGSLYMSTDSSNSQVGAIEWRIDGGIVAQVKSSPGGGNPSIPKGLQFLTYGGDTATTISAGFTNKWTFREDGTLTIPGDIRSEGNINIDINLSDSTLRRWSFGEDGDLRFPDGANYAGQTVTMPTTTNGVPNSFVWEFSDNLVGSDNITLNWNLLASNQGGFYLGTTHSTNGKYLFLDGTDQSLSYVAGGVFGGGKLKFGVSTNGGAGGVNDIELKSSTSDVYITANNKSWKFGEGGLLSLGASSGGIYSDQTTGRISIGDGLNPANGSGLAPSNVFYVGGPDFVARISGYSTGISPVWTFNRDLSMQIPGDIKSDGNINIEINGADSTMRRWSFGEDGNFETPGDITATGNITSTGTITGNILKIEDGVHEKFQELADATGTVTHNCSSGHIFYHSSPDANWTVNLTNLNLSEGYATTITLVIDQGGTGYYPNALQIGGSAQTINWQGNATPTPSTNRQDVVSFSILAVSGGYIVFGQLTGF